MLGVVLYPVNAMLFGPGVYEVVSKMSPNVRFNSFRNAMSPEDMLFKAQDSVQAGGMGHGVCFLLLKREDIVGTHHVPTCAFICMTTGNTEGSGIVNLP